MFSSRVQSAPPLSHSRSPQSRLGERRHERARVAHAVLGRDLVSARRQPAKHSAGLIKNAVGRVSVARAAAAGGRARRDAAGVAAVANGID